MEASHSEADRAPGLELALAEVLAALELEEVWESEEMVALALALVAVEDHQTANRTFLPCTSVLSHTAGQDCTSSHIDGRVCHTVHLLHVLQLGNPLGIQNQTQHTWFHR